MESRSYIDMTRAVQAVFGVESRWQDENSLAIPGGQKIAPKNAGGFARLYTKNRRDAIILYGILNGQDLFAVNDKLFAENEESLY